MKKILLICNKYPLPENTGTNIRTMNFVRFFLTIGRVDIAHLDITPSLQPDHPFEHEYHLNLERNPQGLFKKFYQFVKRKPRTIFGYTPESEALLNSLLRKENYDYILLRYITTASSLLNLPELYRRHMIVDVDDLPSDLLETRQASSTASLISRLKYLVSRKLLNAYEKKFLNTGAILFCSQFDRSKVTSGRRKDNSYVIPNILSNRKFETFPFRNGYQNLQQLLFVGTLKYKPNVDGLIWFLKNIYTKLRKKHPGVHLNVVGRGPDDALASYLQEIEGVTLYSDVPCLESYYDEAGVAIVPILTGGGTRIKILEAGLASRPVMTTQLGAHGLKVENERDILVFDDASDFIQAYEKLHDKAFYERLHTNLKSIIQNNFSKRAFDQVMHQVINDIDTDSKYHANRVHHH